MIEGIREICVGREDDPSSSSAFCHAQEWASRLGLPVRATSLRSARAAGTGAARLWAFQSGIPLARSEADTERRIGPTDLVVFGRSLPKGVQADLRRRLMRDGVPFLACPADVQPLSRMLVLHEGRRDEPFVRRAVGLCAALRMQPIVLTIARSERSATRRSDEIRGALSGHWPECAFDQFIGMRPGPAALLAASWRRCQVVALKPLPERAWWPWGRANTLKHLSATASPLSFLVLPDGGLAETPEAAPAAAAACTVQTAVPL